MALGRGALGWVMCGGLLLGCASRQSRSDAPVVRNLQISGNQALSSRQIGKRILTAATGWWPFAAKRLFDPVVWDADLKRIVRLYATRGFYQAEIVHDAVVLKPPDGVALSIQVREGEPTRVGKLDIQGLEGLPAADRAAALDRLPLAPGAAFEERAWSEAKDGIKTRLRNRGYAKIALDGLALVDVKTRLATLTIAIRPGRSYRFGAIAVATEPGARVAAPSIWELVRLAIPDGRTFSDEAIEEARRRLAATGLFASPGVTAGEPDDATGLVPVEVRVREAPFRTLRVGGGVHFDQARNEIRGLGEWTHRDFFGGMRKLTTRAELGWAFIPDLYAVATHDEAVGPRSGPVAFLGVEFEQPRLLGHPALHWRNVLGAERTLEQTYASAGASISTGVVWQPWTRVSIYPSYHLETDYLSGAPISSAATAPLTLGCQTTDNHCLVWLSYIQETATWDRRDNALEPRRGTYLSLSLQQGGGPLGGNFSYVRVVPDARAYVSFGEDRQLTLSTRLQVGELWPTSGRPEDSAVVTRFYAGGPVSMRGFAERRLSPLLLAPAPNDPSVQITVPVGGNGLINGSFEARYSVTAALRLAAFVDYGQVTTGLVTASAFGHVLWAVGLGVRYLTAIGPIRVDLARRLPFGTLPPLFTTDASGAIGQVPSYPANDSCFGLFGSGVATPVTDSLCVLHISIGEAF